MRAHRVQSERDQLCDALVVCTFNRCCSLNPPQGALLRLYPYSSLDAYFLYSVVCGSATPRVRPSFHHGFSRSVAPYPGLAHASRSRSDTLYNTDTHDGSQPHLTRDRWLRFLQRLVLPSGLFPGSRGVSDACRNPVRLPSVCGVFSMGIN